MNIKAFRKLIKEAVVEAICEQLPEILEEQINKQQRQSLKENKTFSFTSQDVSGLPKDVRQGLVSKMGDMFGYKTPQVNQIQNIEDDENPRVDLSSFIMDTAKNLTAQDISGLRNLD